MMSYHDIMIICSDLPVGKPLHMCIGTAMVHLHICQHPSQNPKYYKNSEPLWLFLNPIFVPVTLPQVFQGTLIPESNLFTFSKTQADIINKQGNEHNISANK